MLLCWSASIYRVLLIILLKRLTQLIGLRIDPVGMEILIILNRWLEIGNARITCVILLLYLHVWNKWLKIHLPSLLLVVHLIQSLVVAQISLILVILHFYQI